jgi:cytochrome c553
MGSRRSLTAIALMGAIAVLGVGRAASAEGDLERGAALFDLCAQCHRSNGHGNKMFLAPAIAGQGEWYIKMQLEKFRNGQRGLHFDDIAGMRMRPMSMTLRSEEDVQHVAAYVASLPAKTPERTLAGDPEKGKTLYVLCAACHGQSAEGIPAMNAPPMNHSDDWYLVEQLTKFKSGIRGTAPGDVTGVLMGPTSPMAVTLTDEESVLDVVAHIMTLNK